MQRLACSFACRAAPMALVAALWAFASPAVQAAPSPLGHFDDWWAFSVTDGGKTTCYVYSEPTKETGEYTSRGKAYAQIATRPADKVKGEVSFTAGYPYKPGSEVTVAVDDKRFALFTKDDTAWARDRAGDRGLVEAMAKGRAMSVTGFSSRGTRTVDTYSLKGVSAALAAIDKACPVR